MTVLLGILIVVLLVTAVLPVPMIHTGEAWIGVHLGGGVNHLAVQGLHALDHGHNPSWEQLILSIVAVIGLGLVVIALAVVSTARAALRGAIVLVAAGVLVMSGAYATTESSRITFWVAAAVAGVVFTGVVVLGRLVAVIATVAVGAADLAALLDIHGPVVTQSAQRLATLSHFHHTGVWGVSLVGLGMLELLIAARIMISGSVRLAPKSSDH